MYANGLACRNAGLKRVLGQHRSTQRRIPRGRADEDRLVADMIELARQHGRYGYRCIAALASPGRLGISTTSASNGCGGGKGCKSHTNNGNGARGSTTVRASG